MNDNAMVDECRQLLEGHAAFLDLLARWYYKPLGQGELDAVAALDVAAFGLGEPLIEEGFRQIKDYLDRGGSTLRQDVNVDYTAAFYGISAYEGKTANPCESVFRSGEGILMQAQTLAAYNAYKREALKKDADLGVPDDHLSFELQFLSIMSTRAAEALGAGDVAEARRNLGVQVEFLDEHILSWFDDLAACAERILETPFYRGVLKVTRGFLTVERADLTEMTAALDALLAADAHGEGEGR